MLRTRARATIRTKARPASGRRRSEGRPAPRTVAATRTKRTTGGPDATSRAPHLPEEAAAAEGRSSVTCSLRTVRRGRSAPHGPTMAATCGTELGARPSPRAIRQMQKVSRVESKAPTSPASTVAKSGLSAGTWIRTRTKAPVSDCAASTRPKKCVRSNRCARGSASCRSAFRGVIPSMWRPATVGAVAIRGPEASDASRHARGIRRANLERVPSTPSAKLQKPALPEIRYPVATRRRAALRCALSMRRTNVLRAPRVRASAAPGLQMQSSGGASPGPDAGSRATAAAVTAVYFPQGTGSATDI